MWHYPARDWIRGAPPCRCMRCSIVARPSRGRSKSFSTEAVYPVRLRRHRQARRYTLRIQAATREVILTIPPRGTPEGSTRVRAEARRLDRGAARTIAGSGAVCAWRRHAAARRAAPDRASSATRGTVWTEIDANGERLLCVAGRAPHIDRRIGDFLRREAKRDLEAASLRYARDLGLAVRRVTVRDQSSRWGSCSTTGMLSFSWRLILAPSHVLDYLAAHEVAHLVEMNHSAKFWRLVKRLCPDHESARAWLDVHGADLHRYGLPDADGELRSRACGHAKSKWLTCCNACLAQTPVLPHHITLNRDLHCIGEWRSYLFVMKAGRVAPHPPTPRHPVR